MIRYSLRCDKDHGFDSWFASGTAFDSLADAGRLSCPVCGSASVEKTLMAPAVQPARKSAAQGALSAPASKMEEAMAALRKQVEDNSEYVGLNFAAEARAIHDGDAPQRAIYGEAKLEEAKRLVEDGVPVAPLPFMPPRKVN